MDKYCVIGHPIAHSKSPQIHAAFAAQSGQQLVYEKLLAPLDGFAATLQVLRAEGYRGANVTVPFKLQAAQLADRLTARARAAGAVNTLAFNDDGVLGDNTDGAGLVADIVHNAGVTLAGKRILLLGAGGAARGALLPLLEQAPSELVIANRTLATAAQLVQDFGAHAARLSAATPEQVSGRFDVIINATSASLAAEVPPLAPDLFDAGTLAMDMMYGDQPTVFMQFAARHGARTRDGLGMLVEQAAEAFALWRGVRPDTAPVLAALRRP